MRDRGVADDVRAARACRHPQADDGLIVLALALVAVPLASSSLVLRAAIWLGLSFHAASWLLAVVATTVAVAAGAWFVRRHGSGLPVGRPDKAAVFLLAAACLAAALAVSLLHRPDSDDSIYLPKTVYAVAHPGVTMDGAIHEIAHSPTLALPLSAAPYYPTAYEFSQAAFSHLTGIDLLRVYYRLAPVVTAVFGMLLLAATLRLLGLSGRAAAFAALGLVPLILLMGESHRSFGNFTLVRLFQAKCAFIFLGPPMFVALSLLFLRRPRWGRWVLLCTGVIALSGMTTSALVMLPLLSLPLLLSWWLVYARGQALRRSVAVGAAYGAALLPAVAFALDYRRYAVARVGYGSALNAGFPKTFAGQLDLVTAGSALSPSVLLPLLSLLVLGWFWRETRHRFLLAVAALTVAFYLNPWVAPWVMRHVSSENIYWRLFYLPPLLLMLGAAVGALFETTTHAGPVRRAAPVFLFVALAVAACVSPTSVLREGNRVEVSAHGYPLDAYARDAQACLDLARPGVMLAPIALARDMVVLSARHAQVVTRPDFLRNALFAEPDEFRRRMSAAAFANGKGGRLGDFVAVMRTLRPATVVIAREALSPAMSAALRDEGMHWAGNTGHWLVYGRAGSGE